MKFGGTSVADAEAIARVIAIVRGQAESRAADTAPVVVVSALAGVTDRLIDAAHRAEDGDADGAAASLNELLERHLAVASALTSGPRQAELIAAVRDELAGVVGMMRALAVLREVSPRSLDASVAARELASSRIVAAALAERGVAAVWVDARTIVITDAEHTGAAPQMAETCARASQSLGRLAASGHVAVLGG